MAEPAAQTEPAVPVPAVQRTPLVMAAVAALSLGAAGYMAVGNGLLPGLPGHSPRDAAGTVRSPPTAGFVYMALEPFMLSLPRTDPVRQLRLELQLEVPDTAQDIIRTMTPRLQDTMNTYLRSIDLSDIENPDTLLRMRMQLLRRLQVAAGDGLIRDLLITQFLIS